jgi:hypothetical protein
LLDKAKQHGVRISFEHGETTVFYCGEDKARRSTALRLWQLGRLVDANDGLLPDCSQTLLVHVTERGDDTHA